MTSNSSLSIPNGTANNNLILEVLSDVTGDQILARLSSILASYKSNDFVDIDPEATINSGSFSLRLQNPDVDTISLEKDSSGQHIHANDPSEAYQFSLTAQGNQPLETNPNSWNWKAHGHGSVTLQNGSGQTFFEAEIDEHFQEATINKTTIATDEILIELNVSEPEPVAYNLDNPSSSNYTELYFDNLKIELIQGYGALKSEGGKIIVEDRKLFKLPEQDEQFPRLIEPMQAEYDHDIEMLMLSGEQINLSLEPYPFQEPTVIKFSLFDQPINIHNWVAVNIGDLNAELTWVSDDRESIQIDDEPGAFAWRQARSVESLELSIEAQASGSSGRVQNMINQAMMEYQSELWNTDKNHHTTESTFSIDGLLINNKTLTLDDSPIINGEKLQFGDFVFEIVEGGGSMIHRDGKLIIEDSSTYRLDHLFNNPSEGVNAWLRPLEGHVSTRVRVSRITNDPFSLDHIAFSSDETSINKLRWGNDLDL